MERPVTERPAGPPRAYEPAPPLVAPEDVLRNRHRRQFETFALGALYRWRRFLVAFPALVTAGAVAVALLLPNEYRATASVLVPDASSSLLASMLGSSVKSAARFLGGGVQVAGYTRMLAILNSERVIGAVADSFDLVRVYDTGNEPDPRAAARDELRDRAAFEVDDEFEYLRVSVLDRDPRRAAAMANLFVRLLNETSTALSTESAGEYRTFIERRYRAAETASDSLLGAVQAFQQRYGVVDLSAQTRAYFEGVSGLRAQQARLQVQLEALRSQAGPEAPEVQGAERALAEATRQFNQALRGGDQAFPVGRGGVPAMTRAYAELERERLIQRSTMEVLAPMYATAQLEETRQTDAVQILDRAAPPARKAEPKRSVIVALSALSALVLGFVFVLAWELWRWYAPALARRFASARAEAGG